MNNENPVRATSESKQLKNLKFDKNFVQIVSLMESLNYKSAKLYNPVKDTAAWLICWHNFNPATGKLERIRRTFDLGRIENIKDRTTQANLYIKVLNKLLAQGYNVFMPLAEILETVETEDKRHWSEKINNKYTTVEQAINDVLQQKIPTLTTRSAQSYSNVSKTFISFLKSKKYHLLKPEAISPDILNEYIQFRLDKKISTTTINGDFSKLGPIFDRMHKMQVIPVNPFSYISSLPTTESSHFTALTEQELTLVSQKLRKEHPELLLFSHFIFYAFVRPLTVAQLQRKHLDFDSRTLYISGNTTKNKKNTTKQMLAPLANLLLELGYDKLPLEHYLFGKKFQPSEEPFASLKTRASEAWKELVIDGLGIKKHLYALKHTSGEMYINNNENPDIGWLQRQMEHSSLEITDIYVKKRKVKKIDESNTNFPTY